MRYNKDAIYGTKPYIPEAPSWEINPKAGDDILFTCKDQYIYVFLTNWNIDAVNLKNFNIGKYSRADHLATRRIVEIDHRKDGIVLNLPGDRNERVSIIRIENISEKEKD